MICQYCRKEKKLIKAHIIPEAFFRRLYGKQSPLYLLTNKAKAFPKRAPIGVYDRNILCLECEKLFGDWDNYAQDILREEPKNASPLMYSGELIGYEVHNYNYALLKLFFISLLWRAAVSTQHFFEKVKLGPYEDKIKEHIVQRNPGSEDDFSVTLAKLNHPLVKPFLDPHPEKWDGINYYRFYLGNYTAYIKTDKRKSPKFHSDVFMKPNAPLLIVCRNLERSNELPLLKKIARATNNLSIIKKNSDFF